MNEFYDVYTLSERLGIAVRTLYEWRRAGNAPKEFTVGRKVLFRAEDVEEWIAGQASQAEYRKSYVKRSRPRMGHVTISDEKEN